MILLPVIERELRVAARSRQTYRNRFIAALSVVGIFVWVVEEFRALPQSALGDQIFSYVTYIALTVALLAGFFFTADCISEERREGTLGLLFLTDLRSAHIVFGKLAANSIPAFFALATTIPVLGIPFLLGGITPGELERAVIILLNGLWLSLASGLLASALVKDDRAALLITFGLIALPVMIAPMFHEAALSAFWALNASRDMLYLGHRDVFWTAVIKQFALPFLYVAIAAWAARVIWRENPPTAAGQARRNRLRVWTGGNSTQRHQWRTEMLDQNPALWLACRRRERTAILWAALGIGAVWLTWIWFTEKRIDSTVGLLASIVSHWILKISIAFAACRAFSDEARNGAFELLFTTELSPARLIKGHLIGLAQSFGPPAAVVFAFDILWAAFGRNESLFSDVRSILWSRDAILVVDLITIAIYGLWVGFKIKRSGRATVRTLIFVVVVPNIAWIFLLTGRFAMGPVLLIWCAMDAALIAIASRNLSTIRQKAAERFVNPATS
jgi:ABC-type transport system involved in cytochrome c biogenesis permease component